MDKQTTGKKGNTEFEDCTNGRVITTFVSDQSEKVIIDFDKASRINSITINDNKENIIYTPLTYHTIPQMWMEVIDTMISLTAWHKLPV